MPRVSQKVTPAPAAPVITVVLEPALPPTPLTTALPVPDDAPLPLPDDAPLPLPVLFPVPDEDDPPLCGSPTFPTHPPTSVAAAKKIMLQLFMALTSTGCWFVARPRVVKQDSL